MPGRKKMRHCRPLQGGRNFKPSGIPARFLEKVLLEMDEFEAIRLCDYEGLNQIEAAERMSISRGTIQRLLSTGRAKVLDVIIHQKELIIPDES